MKYLNPRYWPEAFVRYIGPLAAAFQSINPVQASRGTDLVHGSSTNSNLLFLPDLPGVDAVCFSTNNPAVSNHNHHKVGNHRHRARRAKHRKRNTQGYVVPYDEHMIVRDLVCNVIPAARKGDWEVVKRFTENVINKDSANNTNRYKNKISPYISLEAIKQGNVELVKFFIDNGINIELGFLCILDSGDFSDLSSVNEECSSALFYAIKQCDPNMVELLVNNGANINKISNKGRSVLSYAKAECSNPEIANFLIAKGAVDIQEPERNQLLIGRATAHTPQIRLTNVTTTSIANTHSVGRS